MNISGDNSGYEAYWKTVHGQTDDALDAAAFPGKPRYFNKFFDVTQKFMLGRWARKSAPGLDGQELLDVGCGRGRWLAYFRDRFGAHVQGLELSGEAVADCGKRGFKANEGSVTSAPFGDGCFDIVTSITVLGHVPDEQKHAAISEIARILKDGGKLVLLEPTNEVAMLRAPHVFSLTFGAWQALMARHGLRLESHSAACFNYFRRASPAFLPQGLRDFLSIMLDWLLEYLLMAFSEGRYVPSAIQHLMVFEKLAGEGGQTGPYFSRGQVAAYLEREGQPKGSIDLNRGFGLYCGCLDSNDVKDLYDSGYEAILRGHAIHEMVAGKFPITIFSRYSYLYLRDNLERGRVLDVGCGSGDFALALATEGYDCMGVDFSTSAIEVARSAAEKNGIEAKFLCADVAELAEDEKFDAITLNDVSEHLSDRELAPLFRKAYRLLADGGVLLIHTPNGLAIANDTDQSLLQRVYKFYRRVFTGFEGIERGVDQLFYEQVHINIKSFKQLKTMLRNCGFAASVSYDDTVGGLALSSRAPNMLVVARKDS